MNEADGSLLEKNPAPASRRVFEQADAERLRDMLATVVSDGIGGEAQPTWHSGRGKPERPNRAI